MPFPFGIAHQHPFSDHLLAHPKFIAGDFNTGFIAEHFPSGLEVENG
jgi:propionyl-CoA carboxylase alpha chain